MIVLVKFLKISVVKLNLIETLSGMSGIVGIGGKLGIFGIGGKVGILLTVV
jgi:hypothetical protein